MRIVIGEDSLLLREGIARLLESSGLEVVGTASTMPVVRPVMMSVIAVRS